MFLQSNLIYLFKYIHQHKSNFHIPFPNEVLGNHELENYIKTEEAHFKELPAKIFFVRRLKELILKLFRIYTFLGRGMFDLQKHLHAVW